MAGSERQEVKEEEVSGRKRRSFIRNNTGTDQVMPVLEAGYKAIRWLGRNELLEMRYQRYKSASALRVCQAICVLLGVKCVKIRDP